MRSHVESKTSDQGKGRAYERGLYGTLSAYGWKELRHVGTIMAALFVWVGCAMFSLCAYKPVGSYGFEVSFYGSSRCLYRLRGLLDRRLVYPHCFSR
jgi:hypothetical protein